jgi:septum formation protein
VTRLVLASASKSRARLLENAGVPFTVRPANVDEDAVKASGLDGRAVAERLAELKATAVADELVLGADQVLVCDGGLMSKAATLDEAAEQLRMLRNRRHVLVSAVVLASGGAPVWRHVEESALWMRDFSDAFLDSYLAAEGPDILGGVGCYRYEGAGAQLFARVEGDYFSILGLPLVPLLAALREHGVIGT